MSKSLRVLIIVLLLSATAVAQGKLPVYLFEENDGSPGKVHELTLADKNLHPSVNFMYNENYFFIAITDQGYYGYVNLLVSNTGVEPGQPAISFTVVTPERKRLVKDQDYPADNLTWARDKFEIKVAHNYFREIEGGYELSISQDEMAMRLKFINEVPGIILGNGTAVFGRKDDEEKHLLYINYPAPRPKVTGSFVIGDQTIPVSGWGYIDHSLSLTNPAAFERTWHNVKFHSDTHTVLVSSFTTTDEYEKDFSFAVITDQNRVLCASTDVKVAEHDVKLDEESGKQYPRRVTYNIKGDKCSARAEVDSSKLTEKFDVLKKLEQKWYGKAVKAAINTFISDPWFFRAVTPVKFEITLDGKTTTVQGTAFNEIIYTE